ncbi:MAG: hypothetical protein M3169_06245 [Candidatus Eremiobacteraeota bacterium]|nr:hypothetical protein [Candidatus Eremiobacteraeota bacterium]
MVGAGAAAVAGPRLSRRAWAALAAVVIIALAFWAALSHRVYSRTLPVGLLEHLFGEDDREWRSALVVLRKFYSVVAFTLIGFVVHKALPPARRPALRAAVIVAALSALIEIAQKLRHAHEGIVSNAFDVLCGAFGGWLAVTIARALTRR